MQSSQSHKLPHPRRATVPYTPPPEALDLPGGNVEVTERLQDNHSLRHQSGESVNNPKDHGPCPNDELSKESKLPWWKTPSPWWLLFILPITSISASAKMAPRIEIYTTLVCSIHGPDILGESFQRQNNINFLQQSNDYRIPAVAYQSSSVDISDVLTIEKSLQINDADTPPTRKQRCASDPVVQAAVARLIAVTSASMGILSCITAGWWGAFSDRHGRRSVMGISVIGLLLADSIFILVTLFSKRIPGGYWFLVVGSMVEGALVHTGTAVRAYLADTSNESNRSRIFTLNLGLMLTGMALGPAIGSLLIRSTGQALSVFYMGGCLHLLCSCFFWFIIPESLAKSHIALAKARYADTTRGASHHDGLNAGFIKKAQHLFSFLKPLAIFGPVGELNRGLLQSRRKDWNLTLVALAYGFRVSLATSISFSFQYAASTFGWSSETLGYLLSVAVGMRAIFITFILPSAIKFLQPKPLVLELSVAPTEATPLLNSPSSSSSTPKTIKKEIHSPLFDLNLARVSLLIHIFAYAAVGLSRSPILFAVFTSLGTFGEGFSPAAQSVALALYARNGGIETGRLFGAIGLIEAMSSHIIGPFIYGIVYMKTVATYPPMFFFVSAAVVSGSLCLLSLVKIPKDDEYHRQGLVDPEEPESDEESSNLRSQESI